MLVHVKIFVVHKRLKKIALVLDPHARQLQRCTALRHASLSHRKTVEPELCL